MRSFLKAVLFFVLLVAVSGALLFNFLLNRIARSEEFKRFAEQKVGEYLKATVHIGEIRPYHLNQLALEKILIEAPAAKGGSQLIRADRLLFRYDLGQLWNRKFDAPAGVVLKNPAILIEQDQFPYRYFENAPRGSSGLLMPSLDFKGGEIRYLLSSLGKEILLKEVEGKIQPSSDKKVQVDVRARVTGMVDGRVHIYGIVDPSRSTHDLWLELNTVDLAQDIPLPFKALKGKVHWVGSDLFFEGLQGTVYGWYAELSGAFLNHEGQPEVNAHVRIGKGAPWMKLDFALSLPHETLTGTFQPMEGRVFDFSGKVHQDRKRFVMDSLALDSGYRGRGEFDFSSGNYEMSFEKGAKRMAIHSNLRGLDFVLNFHLDHVKTFGMDLVTQGKLFLHSVTPRWKGRDLFFKGEFETDYFILDRQPFEDMKGVFELSPAGITGIRTTWGKQFQMTGQVTKPGKNPYLKLLLRVEDFDLGTVHQFAARPLPKALGGRLEGRLSVEGDIAKPEVFGVFNIHGGKWGQLDYDRGIIQLRGFLPYLPLRDSKIWKGRTVFSLSGALDLKLDNIFAGVKVQTPDNLVIWKGIEAALHEKDSSLELNSSKLGDWGEFTPLEAQSSETVRGKRAAEVQDAEEDEKTVKFGPKLKF
ncbi:MAG: hypothetical protein PHV97_06785 [Candidatus Omnitrophica bacterium]|nr:hypothetical protein [Candidatus Omnitrophota bacterium]